MTVKAFVLCCFFYVNACYLVPVSVILTSYNVFIVFLVSAVCNIFENLWKIFIMVSLKNVPVTV